MGNSDASLIFDAGLNYDVSFKRISKQLARIINTIEKSGGTKISFDVDENSIKKIEQKLSGLNINGQNSNIGRALRKALKIEDISIPTQFVTDNGQSVESLISNLQNQIGKITNQPVKIRTITEKNKDGNLQTTKASVEYLNKNLGITEQRIYSIEKAEEGLVAKLEKINTTDSSASIGSSFDAMRQKIEKAKIEVDTLSHKLNNINTDYTYKDSMLSDANNTKQAILDNIETFKNEELSIETRAQAYEKAMSSVAKLRAEISNLQAQEKQFDKVESIDGKLATYKETIKKFSGITNPTEGNYSYADIDSTVKAMEGEIQAFKSSTASAEAKQEAYKRLIELTDTYSKQLNNLNSQLHNATSQHKNTVGLTNLQAEVQKIWNQHGDEIWLNTEVYEKFQKVQEKLKHGVGEGGYSSVNEASEAVANLKKELNEADIYTDSLGVSLKNLFGVHLKTQLTMAAIHLLSDGFYQLIDNVKAVDAALTQLQIVTGESGYSIEQFAEKAFKAAQKIGASATDIMSSTETWARLGYSLNESLDLAEITTMFANVGDISVDDATTSMTSILKAYTGTLDVSDAERIAAILVDVGAKYAVSAGGLGEALQRGGASLEAANNSLEESIALITAGNSAVNKIAA